MGFGGNSVPEDYSNVLKDVHAGFMWGQFATKTAETGTDFAEDWPQLVTEMVNVHAGGNPYADVTAYNPDADIADIEDRLQEFFDSVTDNTPVDVLPLAVTWAENNLPTLQGDDDVDDQIEAAAELSRIEHLAAMARVTAGMYDIRATMSTQFGAELAMLEHSRASNITDLQTRLRAHKTDQRQAAIMSLVEVFLRAYTQHMEANRVAAMVQFDASRLKIAAKQDQINFDIEMETRDALFPLELFQYPANFIASLGGVALTPRRETKGERILGAITASATNAFQVGTMTGSPIAGVAAGALTLGADWLSRQQ